jgi:hypothetical protein
MTNPLFSTDQAQWNFKNRYLKTFFISEFYVMEPIFCFFINIRIHLDLLRLIDLINIVNFEEMLCSILRSKILKLL